MLTLLRSILANSESQSLKLSSLACAFGWMVHERGSELAWLLLKSLPCARCDSFVVDDGNAALFSERAVEMDPHRFTCSIGSAAAYTCAYVGHACLRQQ